MQSRNKKREDGEDIPTIDRSDRTILLEFELYYSVFEKPARGEKRKIG